MSGDVTTPRCDRYPECDCSRGEFCLPRWEWLLDQLAEDGAALKAAKKDVRGLERFRDLRLRHNEEMERRTIQCGNEKERADTAEQTIVDLRSVLEQGRAYMNEDHGHCGEVGCRRCFWLKKTLEL